MKEKLVTSPKLDPTYRTRLKSITNEYGFEKASDAIGFLLSMFDLIFKDKEFENPDEMLNFITQLLTDESEFLLQSIELQSKIDKIREIIEM